MCVTRFDQSECVICRVIFRARKEPFLEVYVVKFSLYSKLVLVISTLFRRGKLLEHFILIAVALLLNIFLSWAFVTSLNCSVMCRPAWWFECCFCRSSWIHFWWLLAVLLNYFGPLVTSTFLLCKFVGLPGSTPVSFPVMSRWKSLGIKTSSQPSGTTRGKRAEKTCRSGGWREASNAKSRKSLFYFKPEKVNKFEYCNNLWKQNIFHNPVRKLKAWL